MKNKTETFPPVGACGNCRNYGKKQNATLLFPTVAWISQAIKLARLIHSYHRRGCHLSTKRRGTRERGACHGRLNWVRKTRHKLRGWVNDGENPWVNDSENPQNFWIFHGSFGFSIEVSDFPQNFFIFDRTFDFSAELWDFL